MKTGKIEFAPFEAAEFLDNDEVIAEYLAAAAEDDNPNVLLAALLDVAKAKSMGQVAERAGLGRESLYKALRPGAKPRFETIKAVMKAMDLKISIASVPIQTPKSGKLKRAS
ncbi:MAG: putative addiction module antidote protein [Aestuariivirgaceae bacterium]|nr:putative addiction module antidote protein [Aestuariivirgaceae bacterium]